MTFSSQIDAFSPSQDAADDSTTTPSKFQGASGTTPLTVKQIADAQLACAGEKGAPFVVDGVETDNIRVVGMVSGKAERATDVSFTLDHGTGRIDFIKWVNDAADSAETAAIQNGTYVSVIGTLKGLQDKKHATAFCVRPVTDYNEVPMHFTQCLRMHIVNTKSKVGSPAQTAGTPFSNNLSEASAPTSLKSNPPPVTSGTYGSWSDLCMRVLNVFSEPASIESDHGVHIHEIAKQLRLPAGKIEEVIEFHANCGHIYSTIDDFHYKSAFIDRVCNPPPVISGTNGSGNDLYTQVLNVFSEPAGIESDHGVHIDEIAKRLTLPAGKIKEAIEFHVNCGNIFSTADDFHYKSASIDRVCNPPTVTSGTNGSETDLFTQVLNVFSEPASIESDHGVHIDEIAKRLTLPAGKIREAIEFHVNCGHIFSTIDDFHYKSAFIDRVCNPPTVTSGTNGSETDLFTPVLNVFSEPASIESDHGVHIDEIAKRLTLPAGKIREAIEFHVNCGHIFSTIDDFHYKSAFIDRVCNPPTVTSGTNGSETDLFTQVLNVFSEPASIDSDHGVHIDEIPKRLTLPAGKIREAIEFHVNCGHIFSTIDDFHYKSAFIDRVCNPPTVTSGTNGSETDLFTQVLNVFSEPASIESDHGVHIDEIAKRLTLPAGKIEAIEFHVNCGHIFSTIDDFHYKSAFVDRVCNPPTVTSGTNGSETDLFTQVLNVFSEPASIESDHGVHIDEIAKRLTLPAGKIREAIEFHVNCGHIFSTIDDFHYKSAFIDRVCNPVLNVFSEPASIESDHGVHIDEIAKRLTLPAGKIREAMEFHVNCGHIFSTIDDFHYKSAFIDRVCNPVLNLFSEPASIESDHGVHIDEIAKRLTLPAGKIREAMEFHVNCGHIFSTIDDFHYKSAFIDRVCNPPTVTSGTNGSETDLFTQVLNVFSEPASIESDHGLHIDEIAMRLKLPAGKIREAINFLVDCGRICSTIDDFHYKSAFVD